MLHPDRLGARVNNWGLLAFCGGAFLLYQIIPLPFSELSPFWLAVGITLAGILGVVAPFFVLTRRLGIPFRLQFQFERPRLAPMLAVGGATLSLVPLLSVVTWHMSRVYPPDSAYLDLMEKYRTDNIFGFGMMAVALVLAGPLAEEVLFRGVVQRLLMRQSRPVVAILLTSAVFGSVHPLYAMPGACILGIYFGILAYLLGNLWYPLAAHAIWNLLSLLVLKSAPETMQLATPFTAQPVLWCVLSIALFAFFSRFWVQARH